MSTVVTYNGTSYTIPATGDTNWGDQVALFLIAVAGSSAVITSAIQTSRTSTAATTNVLTSDYAVYINHAGAASVVLPTSTVGQIYTIQDSSGAAHTNNITISVPGGQTIDGASTYVLADDKSGIVVQFIGSNAWRIVARKDQDLRRTAAPTFGGPVTINPATGTAGAETVYDSSTGSIAGKAWRAISKGAGNGGAGSAGDLLFRQDTDSHDALVLTSAGGTSILGTANIASLSASLPVKTDSSKNLTSAAINLASATEVTGALAAANFPALTGDITTSAGALATTLATVNTNTGSWGSSTAIPVFTVNGKGLITAASTAAVVAPASTLTGTTLASGVVSSSLTSVGTIATGVWSGTPIVYSKLNLTGAILNADLAGSIAYSKLSLTGAILNADLAGSIAYSKLSLTGAILNADLAGSIATSKITAPGTSGQILNGDWSVTTTLPATRGGTGLATATTGDILYASGTNTWASRAAVATGQVLISQGTSTAPVWSAAPTLTSVSFDTAGTGTTSVALNHYEEWSAIVTFKDTAGTPNTVNVTVHITRIGRQVFLSVPDTTTASGTASNTDPFFTFSDTGSNIPTRFAPTTTQNLSGQIGTWDGSTFAAGTAQVTSSNIYVFYNTFNGTPTHWGSVTSKRLCAGILTWQVF